MSNSTFTLSTLLPATLLALTTVACVSEENDPGALEFRDTCPLLTPNCQTNSPEINEHPLDAVALNGTPNAGGVWISGIKSPASVVYTLKTSNRELAAYSGNTRVAMGSELVGYKLIVHYPGGVEEAPILAVDRSVPSWASGGQFIVTYAIAFTPTNNPAAAKNICPTWYNEPSAPVATIIVGETYDHEAKTVHHNMPGWITIACADEAAYKAKRMNYDAGSDFDGMGNPATWQQRQATIKMITADYSGQGLSFTAQDTPLLWKNRSGAVNTYTTSFKTEDGLVEVTPEIEAIWGANGAICFNAPRNKAVFGAILDDDPNTPVCEAPACTVDCSEIDLVNDDYEWITWVMPTFD